MPQIRYHSLYLRYPIRHHRSVYSDLLGNILLPPLHVFLHALQLETDRLLCSLGTFQPVVDKLMDIVMLEPVSQPDCLHLDTKVLQHDLERDVG